MIAYVPEHLREQTMRNLKNFRKFNTKNTDRFFHFKFWFLDDQNLAKTLKIETSDSAAGDVYIVRPSSQFNLTKPNCKLCDYDYSSSKILTSEDILRDVSGS